MDKIGDRSQAIALAEASIKAHEEIEDIHTAMVRQQLAEWRGQAKQF
ncbi:MAG TPA: hypothetical protein VGB07_19745 [Blastocatellia bacterium]